MTPHCPCGGATTRWVSWPEVPLVNHLSRPSEPPAPRYDLDLHRCLDCGTLQVADPPPPEVIFPPDYPYQSGAAFRPHAEGLARQLALRLGSGYVLDVGANDGTFVRAAFDAHLTAIGLDPARPEADLQGFFPAATRSWTSEYWDAITALNVFAHIPDPLAFAEEAARLLRPGGWFIVEVSDLARVLAGARLDVLYHEHMWTWTRTGLVRTLAQVGLHVQDIETYPAQGGAIRIWAQKGGPTPMIVDDTYLRGPELFAQALEQWYARMDRVRETLDSGGSWAGYGAAAKGAMVAYHAMLGPEHLQYVVDETPDKQGKLTPYGVPIVPPERLTLAPTDGVLILAWNYASRIREKLRQYPGRVVVV